MPDTTSQGSRFSFQVPVRLYGPVLLTPKPIMINGKPKGDPEYSTRFFFPKDHPEVKAFASLLSDVAQRKFGTTKGIALPYQLGDKWADAWAKKNADKIAAGQKNPRDFARGGILVRASSKNFPPRLSFINGSQVIDIPDETRATAGDKFYSGVSAGVEVNLVAYEGNGSNIPDCVKAYLTQVCSLCRGEHIGGATGAATFGGLVRNAGQVSDVDPTTDEGDDELASLAG